MSTLVVTAHPDTASLTHQAAHRVQQLLGPGASSVAHLAQEGFDPRFTLTDRDAYLGRAELDPAVVAEQERIDRAQHLVLVFPVHWWSLPALLKGWVDRVFVAGWAFDDTDGRIVPRLQGLTVHQVPITGAGGDAWLRHGYLDSFRTQVQHGVVDFCGARPGVTAFVHDTESGDTQAVAAAVEAAASSVASAITDGARAYAGRPVA